MTEIYCVFQKTKQVQKDQTHDETFHWGNKSGERWVIFSKACIHFVFIF